MKKIIGICFGSAPWSVDLAALLLRVIMGGFMAYAHGWGKFQKWDEYKLDFATPFGMPDDVAAALTIFAELFACIFIVAGLFTRIATIPIIICMAVAAFNIHAGDPLVDREGAITYLATFLVVLMLGPGKYSLDHLFFKRNKR